jgi:VIT1/CCC1 family predicted Fe2+/Mn2+ transporter
LRNIIVGRQCTLWAFLEQSYNHSVTRPQHEHTPAAIRARLSAGPTPSYVRDFVYGAIDGGVTTFAIVSGAEGAGLSIGVVLVLGIANVVADGFSMGVSNYLATRAELEVLERTRLIEEDHIRRFPEGEREEVRQIFSRKGFSGETLEHIVATVTSDRKRWIETMLQEEYGLSAVSRSPARAGLTTFGAFMLLGALPLLPFLLRFLAPESGFHPYTISAAATFISFFAVGAVKAKLLSRGWLGGGLETVFVGGGAAILAFVLGSVLQRLIS